MQPEDDLVVLVDADGQAIGEAPRSRVHTTNTPLHRAFSMYLFDRDGRALVTRRALGKLTWPGVWSNACCGHPRPGEATEAAVRRRVRQELGAEVAWIKPAAPHFAYRAVDASGIVENEICPVFVGGLVTDALEPDPDEVMAYTWVEWADLVERAAAGDELSPWSIEQIPLVDAALRG